MNNNILQLCFSPDLGGLELYVKKISSYLNEKSNLTVILNEKGRLKEEFKKSDIRFIGLKKPSKLPFKSALDLSKIIDKNAIDVIHIHWTKDIPVAVLAKLFSQRKPKLIQTRHMTMTRFKSDFYHTFLYKNIDLMIAVTQQVNDQITKFVPSHVRPKVQTLYIGANKPKLIDDEKKALLQQKYGLNKFTIGIVGRIEEGKGQYLLIDAIKELKKNDIETQALIVGHAMTEEYLKELQSQIKADGIENNIIFTGFTSEVQNLMQVCDVIVLATYKETFGLVLIEAMQSGIAVIGSDSGGPLEIIKNNKSGLLFKTKDSNDLALKIKQLYDNPQEKEELALNGKTRAQKLFDEQNQFEEVLAVLKAI